MTLRSRLRTDAKESCSRLWVVNFNIKSNHEIPPASRHSSCYAPVYFLRVCAFEEQQVSHLVIPASNSVLTGSQYEHT